MNNSHINQSNHSKFHEIIWISDLRMLIPFFTILITYGFKFTNIEIGLLSSSFILVNGNNIDVSRHKNKDQNKDLPKHIEYRDIIINEFHAQLLSFFFANTIAKFRKNMPHDKFIDLSISVGIDFMEGRAWHGDSPHIQMKDLSSVFCDICISSVCNFVTIFTISLVPELEKIIPNYLPINTSPYTFLSTFYKNTSETLSYLESKGKNFNYKNGVAVFVSSNMYLVTHLAASIIPKVCTTFLILPYSEEFAELSSVLLNSCVMSFLNCVKIRDNMLQAMQEFFDKEYLDERQTESSKGKQPDIER